MLQGIWQKYAKIMDSPLELKICDKKRCITTKSVGSKHQLYDMKGDKNPEFKIKEGVKQGCIQIPSEFN